MLKFTYRPEKTAQAGAHLLFLAGGSMDPVELTTLLYLADRASLVESGMPITGDRMVAMPYGPALGETLACARGKRSGPCAEGGWNDLVVAGDAGELRLATAIPPSDELSEFDINVLDATFEKWVDGAQTVAVPEWSDPGLKPKLIDPGEILRLEGWDESDIEVVRGQLAAAIGL